MEPPVVEFNFLHCQKPQKVVLPWSRLLMSKKLSTAAFDIIHNPPQGTCAEYRIVVNMPIAKCTTTKMFICMLTNGLEEAQTRSEWKSLDHILFKALMVILGMVNVSAV